jgi:hypothetical protein
MLIRIQEPKLLKNLKSKEIVCFEVMNVLFGGLKASPVAGTSFMEAGEKMHFFLSKKGLFF